MHLLVCIHGRIISQFETQHSSVACLVSQICPVANAAERPGLTSTNIPDAIQCNVADEKVISFDLIQGVFFSSEGALYVILPYDYPAAPTFWTHTGP